MPKATFLNMTQPLQKKMIDRVQKCAFVNRELVYDYLQARTVPNDLKFEVNHNLFGHEGGRIILSNFSGTWAGFDFSETNGHIQLCMSELAEWGLHAPMASYAYSDNNQRIAAIRAYLSGMVMYDLTKGTEFGDWMRRFPEPDLIYAKQNNLMSNDLWLQYVEVETVEAIMLGDTQLLPEGDYDANPEED